MKKFFRRIHLYLSLAVGLVVMVTCLTGAILVFEEELQHGFNKERYYVEPGSQRLPLDQLVANVKKIEPKAKVNRVQVYNDPSRSVVINYAGGSKSQAFVNQYTGEVLELYSYRDTFFYTIFALHRWMLAEDIGKMIVGVSTLVFLFILITGIVLWWPRNRRLMANRLKIKTGTGWKRLTHDYHVVLGFYSAIFLFIFGFTGLAWSFEWFNKAIYTVTNSPVKAPKPPQSASATEEKTIGFETAFQSALAQFGETKVYSISMPKDSVEPVSISSVATNAPHESASDVIYLDQYSGKKMGQMYFNERSKGARVRSTFKPVHTGSIYGMPSKIIAFVTCLLGFTFPITGYIMWINRTRKKKKIRKSGSSRPVEEEYSVVQ